MNWHTTQELGDITPDETSSLVVAFSNLLQRLDINKRPQEILEALETEDNSSIWATITSIEPRLMPTLTSDEPGWPEGSNSIMRFKYVDEKGDLITYYCAIASPASHTIIDSNTGKVQYSGVYGEPTGWATYALVELDEDEETDQPKEETPPTNPNTVQRSGVLYKVLSGDNIWRIATQYQLPVEDILAHNEITDPKTVVPGTYIYLPLTTLQKNSQPVIYEILPSARPMHVSNAGGAKKWSFGNVRSWRDIHDNGQHYPQNHNLLIVAIAHVPIEGETAAYYLDATSFGNYRTTGLVRYTTGFNWQHLADGHVYPEFNPDTPIEEVIAQEIEEMTQETEPEPIPEEVKAVEVAPEPIVDFRDSYRPLTPGPVQYRSNKPIIVKDIEGIHTDRTFPGQHPFKIAGTFMDVVDGETVVYGLPAGLIRDGSIRAWYGVKMDDLYNEDDLYNTSMSLKDKVAVRNQLSLDERLTVIFSRQISRLEYIKIYLARKK